MFSERAPPQLNPSIDQSRKVEDPGELPSREIAVELLMLNTAPSLVGLGEMIAGASIYPTHTCVLGRLSRGLIILVVTSHAPHGGWVFCALINYFPHRLP